MSPTSSPGQPTLAPFSDSRSSISTSLGWPQLRLRESRITCQVLPLSGSAAAPARQPLEKNPTVPGAMWAASALRPNTPLPGVLGSSGLARVGSGGGLRLPLSCADDGVPIANRTAQPSTTNSRRALIGVAIVTSIVIESPGHLVLLIRRPATQPMPCRRICQTPDQS